jgi:hypothetical protein
MALVANLSRRSAVCWQRRECEQKPFAQSKGPTMSENPAGGMPQDVLKEWDAIRSAACELHWFWRFHSELGGNPEHVVLMQEILPGPFALIRRAFLSSIVMGIGRLLDKDESRVGGRIRPNLSLARLLKIIEPHIRADLKSGLARMLNDLQTLCEPIDLWRDKRFGHADKEMVLCTGDVALPNVDREIFEEALGMIYEMLKVIHVHINGAEMEMPFPVPVGYADALMGFVRDGDKARKAEIASMFP